MPGIADIFAGIVETAITVVPELLEVPILGRLLISLGFGQAHDTHAIEQLQEQAQKKKTDRKTRRERNNRYVLKASDAMQCVEDNLMDGQLLFSLVKGLAHTIMGRGDFAPDLILDKIWTCIEEHELRQDTPRVKGEPKGKYVRPRKGHGHGRGKF